jgi:hypothetical protein
MGGWMDGCGRIGESANDEEEKSECTEEETITSVLPQIILVWWIPNNMFQYRPWTLTNTGAVGGSSLYCYYTEESCNKKIRKKRFVQPLKLLQ